MAKISRQVDRLFLTLSGPAASELICMGARVRDDLSRIPELRMEFYSKDTSFDPKDVLGTRITLKAENGFVFSGIVISVEDLGHQDNIDLFAAEVRPWTWLMTIGSDNRVFQGMTTPEIVKKVFSDAGFTDVTDKTTATYEQREYCVQYGESNFDFVSRIMEEDGVYYFFDHSGATEKIVLADSVSAHENRGRVPFTSSNQVGERQADSDTIFEWSDVGKVVTGKVSLFDYDMTKPNADLKVKSAVPSGQHSFNQIERYLASGHYKVADKGTNQARARAEAHAAGSQRAVGVCNAAKIMTGGIFTLEHPNRSTVDGDYLVTRATHYMLFNPGFGLDNERTVNRHVDRIEYPAEMALYETEFEVQKSSVPYRPICQTPWPEVPSLLTAKVTGPGGEEIYTDDYGRIKVIFPWDRLGEPKEKSSCWVRSVVPWAGKDWGMQSIPRIGMEVIIQFERGNIDRPYCTGMVYNAVNMPPYALPGEMTKTGLRTNSSKGGGGFHELTFDDKKGEEKIFFQSEKDYQQLIKNDAVITIGMEKKGKGDLTQTIHRHKTETLKTGDHTFSIEAGSESVTISKDQTESVGENKSVTIGNNTELTVGADREITVGGSNAETIGSDNSLTVGADYSITVGGKLTIVAGSEISLTVGGSKVTIGPAGITIKGAMVTVEGQAMTEVKGTLVAVKGSAMTQISGGVVMVG